MSNVSILFDICYKLVKKIELFMNDRTLNVLNNTISTIYLHLKQQDIFNNILISGQ